MKNISKFFKAFFTKSETELLDIAIEKICFYKSRTRYQFFSRAYYFALSINKNLEKELIQIAALPSNDIKNKKLKEFIKNVNKETNKMPYTVNDIN